MHDRIRSQVKKIKTVKYMGTYAHPLETLARAKFGDKGINENELITKKFLDTVSNYVYELMFLHRKEKMR